MSTDVSTAQIRAWRMPDIEGAVLGSRHRRDFFGDTPEEADAALERLKQQAWDAGMAQARADIDAMHQQLAAQYTTLQSALAALAQPMLAVDEQVRAQLTELATVIARHVLRRELRSDPAQVIAIVRETVGLLPAATPDVRVVLHPEDAALLRERLSLPQGEGAWTLFEDPTLSRGGCRVTAGVSQIDARTESRMAAVIVSLLGEERVRERANGETSAP
jgi:flagellar assembly protein FliH